MDDEGQRAAATIESLSICRNQLFGAPSLTDIQQPTDYDPRDNTNYDNNGEDAFIDMSDDILTFSVPPVNFERTTSENFADIILSQLDNKNANFPDDTDALNEINTEPLNLVPLSAIRSEATALQLEFDVTVEGGRQSAYILSKTYLLNSIANACFMCFVFGCGKRSLTFAKMNTNVIFVVNCPVPPPPKSFVRICAIYSDNIYANVPVRRCDYHRLRDRNYEEHFLIVTNNSKAQHLTEKVEGEEGFRSFAIVPFDAIHANRCLMLQFRCYSSCAGGINRRQVVLCFSLENGGNLLGDSKMHLKVCSLPSRDANLDVNNMPRNKRPAAKHYPAVAEVVSVSAKNKPEQPWDDDDTVYSLEIRGRHLYKIVCAIVGNFELTRNLLKDKNQRNDREMLTVSDSSGSLSQNTPIDSWLNTLELSKYKHLFADRSLYVIADLDGIVNKMYLLSIGVTEEDAIKMLNSYLSWFNIFNAQRLSSLSSDGSTIRVQRTRVSGSIRASHTK